MHDFYRYDDLQVTMFGTYTSVTGQVLDLPQPIVNNGYLKDKEEQDLALDNIE